MPTPAIAEEICRRYLAAFDELHPSLLTGLYLVGSIALDDFHPNGSDIDFVAVTQRPVDLVDVASIHAGLHRTHGQPFFDGLYVTGGELRALPDRSARGLAVLNGVPMSGGGGERHAVTWLTLARHGITVRGSTPNPSWIAASLPAAQAYSRENLDSYWRGWVGSHRVAPDLDGKSIEAVTWSVLGVSRLHALIAEGLVLSKTGAGRYALAAFPQHRPIIESALAAHLGGGTGFAGGPSARHKAMLAFLDDAITDAGTR